MTLPLTAIEACTQPNWPLLPFAASTESPWQGLGGKRKPDRSSQASRLNPGFGSIGDSPSMRGICP